MSLILFLFLTHLGTGIAWTLPLVSRQAGVKFFRFNAGLAAALLVVALALRPSAAGLARTWTPGLWMIAGALAALAIYWATVGRMLARLRGWLLAAAVLAGTAALVMQALAVAPSADTIGNALTILSFVASAALLGGACTAMILGHWYLILPSMEIALLQRVVRFHLGSLALRVLAVALVLFLAWRGVIPTTIDLARYVTSTDGVFLWQRILFGLVGPAALGWLTWETAKIRSTQSATGILYVDFFTVIVGEVLAKYLLMDVSLPL